MDAENNIGVKIDPESAIQSDRERFRELNKEELSGAGSLDKDENSKSNQVADVKEEPVVKVPSEDVEGKGFKRRVDTLTSRNKSLESELAAMRKEFNEFKNPKQPKKELNENMFLDQSDYVKALARQNALEALDERESQRGRDSEESAKVNEKAAQEQARWNERVVKTYGDPAIVEQFYAKVSENMDVVSELPTDIHDFIDDSPVGVKLLDALITHPQIREYLMNIKSPTYRAKELGEIEKALSTPSSATPVKAVTKAPAPIGTVTAGGNAIINDDDLTFRERLLKKQKQRNR